MNDQINDTLSKIVTKESRLTDKQRLELGSLLMHMIECIPRFDGNELLQRRDLIEEWVANQIDLGIMKATAPLIKLDFKKGGGKS